MDFTTYPFLNIMWTFFIIFFWVSVFVLLIRIITDVFRRNDIGGGAKAAWAIVLVCLPLLGSLIYLIKEGSHLGKREWEEATAAQAELDAFRIAQAGTGRRQRRRRDRAGECAVRGRHHRRNRVPRDQVARHQLRI